MKKPVVKVVVRWPFFEVAVGAIIGYFVGKRLRGDKNE